MARWQAPRWGDPNFISHRLTQMKHRFLTAKDTKYTNHLAVGPPLKKRKFET